MPGCNHVISHGLYWFENPLGAQYWETIVKKIQSPERIDQAPHREGANHPGWVYAEAIGREGDVSGDVGVNSSYVQFWVILGECPLDLLVRCRIRWILYFLNCYGCFEEITPTVVLDHLYHLFLRRFSISHDLERHDGGTYFRLIRICIFLITYLKDHHRTLSIIPSRRTTPLSYARIFA